MACNFQVDFASFGSPTGVCNGFVLGKCHAANSTTIVSSYCLGKPACTIPVNVAVFGDPCVNITKQFVVQVILDPLVIGHSICSIMFGCCTPETEGDVGSKTDYTVIYMISCCQRHYPTRIGYAKYIFTTVGISFRA